MLDLPAGTGQSAQIAVGAIVIDGLAALDRSDFAAVIEPFAGRALDRAELRGLTDAIASHSPAHSHRASARSAAGR
ncbi:MAG: hypothetical protein ACK4RT_10765 [Erythrobacter sp.]